MHWLSCFKALKQVLEMISIKVCQPWTHKSIVKCVPVSICPDIPKPIYYPHTLLIRCYSMFIATDTNLQINFCGPVAWILLFIKGQPFITIQLNHLTISHPSVPMGTEPLLKANTCTTHRVPLVYRHCLQSLINHQGARILPYIHRMMTTDVIIMVPLYITSGFFLDSPQGCT